MQLCKFHLPNSYSCWNRLLSAFRSALWAFSLCSHFAHLFWLCKQTFDLALLRRWIFWLLRECYKLILFRPSCLRFWFGVLVILLAGDDFSAVCFVLIDWTMSTENKNQVKLSEDYLIFTAIKVDVRYLVGLAIYSRIFVICEQFHFSLLANKRWRIILCQNWQFWGPNYMANKKIHKEIQFLFIIREQWKFK